jgi:hypothetical protein
VFKRTFWFGSGVVVGAGGTVWASVRLRRAAARITPGGVADHALTRAKRVGNDVRDAVAEGRFVMRETESQLRRDISPPAIESSPIGGLAAIDTASVEVAARNPARPLVARR